MTFPVVASVAHFETVTDATSHTINMPATVDTGDILLIIWANDGGTATQTWNNSTLGTWTLLHEVSNQHRSAAYWKIADGTEGGGSMLITTSAGEKVNGSVLRITGGQSLEIGTVATGSGTLPNPPSLTPSWGADDTLWLVSYTNDGNVTTSAYPTNYASNQYNDTTNVATGDCGHAYASYEQNTTVQDPANFTLSATEDWVTQTYAIEPAAATSGTITSVDTDNTFTPGQLNIAVAGTGLLTGASAEIVAGSQTLVMTGYVPSATAPEFDSPSLADYLTAGIKFGSATFKIKS